MHGGTRRHRLPLPPSPPPPKAGQQRRGNTMPCESWWAQLYPWRSPPLSLHASSALLAPYAPSPLPPLTPRRAPLSPLAPLPPCPPPCSYFNDATVTHVQSSLANARARLSGTSPRHSSTSPFPPSPQNLVHHTGGSFSHTSPPLSVRVCCLPPSSCTSRFPVCSTSQPIPSLPPCLPPSPLLRVAPQIADRPPRARF